MELHYSDHSEPIQHIEDRLKKMTLAHQIVQSKDNIQPYLKDGSKEYHGVEQMNSYLDQLDREKEQWYYCNC